jgi:hypothetical protein
MMTPEQIIKALQARQRQLLKIRSKPKRRSSSDKVIDRVVRPKGTLKMSRRAMAYERYQRKRLGLRPPSKVRIIMKDGQPT